MNVHIVTEGRTDELIIRELLRRELGDYSNQIRIVEGGGRSSAQSLARSILGARQEPVALVVDSDTTNVDQIAGQRDFLTWYMNQAADPQMWRIVLFRPTVEAVLFSDPAIIQSLLKIDPDERQKVRAEYDPKRVLSELLLQTKMPEDQLWKRFRTMRFDWDSLAAKLPELHALKEFIHKHCEPVAA